MAAHHHKARYCHQVNSVCDHTGFWKEYSVSKQEIHSLNFISKDNSQVLASPCPLNRLTETFPFHCHKTSCLLQGEKHPLSAPEIKKRSGCKTCPSYCMPPTARALEAIHSCIDSRFKSHWNSSQSFCIFAHAYTDELLCKVHIGVLGFQKRQGIMRRESSWPFKQVLGTPLGNILLGRRRTLLRPAWHIRTHKEHVRHWFGTWGFKSPPGRAEQHPKPPALAAGKVIHAAGDLNSYF